jgi:hypothetical protein
MVSMLRCAISCHAELDQGRAARVDKRAMWTAAHFRTMRLYWSGAGGSRWRVGVRRTFWTAAQLALLHKHYPHLPTERVARIVGRDVKSVYAKANGLRLRKSAAYLASDHSGRITKLSALGMPHRFRAGLAPWNKGKTGWQAGGRSVVTQFKPGQRSKRWERRGPVRDWRACAERGRLRVHQGRGAIRRGVRSTLGSGSRSTDASLPAMPWFSATAIG